MSDWETWLAVAGLIVTIANLLEPKVSKRWPRAGEFLRYAVPFVAGMVTVLRGRGGKSDPPPPAAPPPDEGAFRAPTPPPSTLRVLVVAAALTLTGCAGAEKVVEVATLGVRLANAAQPLILEGYKLQQEKCLELPEPERKPCVDAVRARYAPVGALYREMQHAASELEPKAEP